MTLKPKHAFVAISASLAILGAWFFLIGFDGTISPRQIKAVDTTVDTDASGPLDGMTFVGSIGTVSKPDRTQDSFIFSNGKFVSTECVKTCGYHAGTYFVRQRDGEIEFLSVSRCHYKDAKIEWRGTIRDGVVKGQSTWTVNRWYRTIEKKLVFQGRLVEPPKPVVGR